MGWKHLFHCESFSVIQVLCIRRSKVVGDRIIVSFMGVFLLQILLVYMTCFLEKDVNLQIQILKCQEFSEGLFRNEIARSAWMPVWKLSQLWISCLAPVILKTDAFLLSTSNLSGVFSSLSEGCLALPVDPRVRIPRGVTWRESSCWTNFRTVQCSFSSLGDAGFGVTSSVHCFLFKIGF